MSVKTYVFAVYPPVGDDYPGAFAAIPSTSPTRALKMLGEAGLRAISKDPVAASPDLSLFEERTAGEILWRAAGEEQWRALGK